MRGCLKMRKAHTPGPNSCDRRVLLPFGGQTDSGFGGVDLNNKKDTKHKF